MYYCWRGILLGSGKLIFGAIVREVLLLFRMASELAALLFQGRCRFVSCRFLKSNCGFLPVHVPARVITISGGITIAIG